MGWGFRKTIKTGRVKTTLSRKGLTTSWGIPGIRVGVSNSGKKYIKISIPGTGLFWTKFFD